MSKTCLFFQKSLLLNAFLGVSSVFPQGGKLFISAYRDSNYAIRFVAKNNAEFSVLPKDSIETAKQTLITKLEISQFRNAIQQVLEIKNDTLAFVSYDLLNQINREQAEFEVVQRFKDEELKENVAIASLGFKNGDHIVPLLLRPSKEDFKTPQEVSIPGAIQQRHIENLKQSKVDTLSHFKVVPANGFYRIDRNENHLKVSSVEIAFEDGTIKDILIRGRLHYEKTDIFFQNSYAISVSTPRHIERLNSRGNNLLLQMGDAVEYYIDLADIITYDRIVAMGSGHYVPKNQVLRLDGTIQRPIVLMKNPFFDNFDIRLYTDVTGLERENPNGLIQTEGRYHVVLNTKPWWPYEKFLRNILLLNRISPFVNLSKLENKLKDLPLEASSADSFTFFRTTAVNVLRFANLNVGIDVNLLSWVGTHTKFRVNGVIGLYRTKVDSVAVFANTNSQITTQSLTPKQVVSYYWMPVLSLHMIDGDKLDFDVTLAAIYLDILENNIALRNGRVVKKYQVNLNVHPNANQQDKSIFFRTTFFYTGKRNNNLSLQIGYSAPISKLF